jgi:hypothetical protein
MVAAARDRIRGADTGDSFQNELLEGLPEVAPSLIQLPVSHAVAE